MQPPYCQYVDWMHTWVSSGGLAQQECNGLVLSLCSHGGFSLEDIDELTSGVKLPLGVTKISKRFWSDRIVDRPMTHMKAFASEMLTAIVLLGFL
jgi:hypothetical protein